MNQRKGRILCILIAKDRLLELIESLKLFGAGVIVTPDVSCFVSLGSIFCRFCFGLDFWGVASADCPAVPSSWVMGGSYR